MSSIPERERLARWRLVIGSEAEQACGPLAGPAVEMDQALTALYDSQGNAGGLGASPRGGRGGSRPSVARWLGDIRKYFPSSVVQVMQHDALQRLNLREMLLQPEMLRSAQPDVHLVASLIALSRVIPAGTKDTARMVVKQVVDDLMKRLEEPMRSAISGALDRSQRNRRPRHAEIDWHRTIRANLRHWQPEYRTVVPETLHGYGRKARKPQREIILCIDQSGSMANSVVYASIFGAVMASLPAVSTKLVVFDTNVVDMSDQLDDPVELLFGVQLGGGTDINSALAYCQGRVANPRDTIFVLISDLYEGGDNDEMLRRAAAMVASDMQVVCLLALSDDGAPSYDHDNAAALAALGVPTFACTPDRFPDLIAAAIQRDDLAVWAGNNDIQLAVPEAP